MNRPKLAVENRPKLAVEEVFVLSRVYPYEGSEVDQVFISLDVAQKSRPEVKHWYQEAESDNWASIRTQSSGEPFWLIEKFPVRSK